MKSPLLSSLVFLSLGMGAASASVALYAEYHLGESGSLGAGNQPLDSSGNGRNIASSAGGTAGSVGTVGVMAPGSSAYLDTSAPAQEGWYSNNLYSTLPIDDFGLGLYVRAEANTGATQGTIFSLGGSGGAFNFSLEASGWHASAFDAAYIGGSSEADSAAPFTADLWVHLALIRVGGVTTFYVDGAPVGTTYAGAPANGTVHLSVKPGGTVFFDGMLDEARVVTFTAGESTQNVLNALQAVPETSSVLLGSIGLLGLCRRRR